MNVIKRSAVVGYTARQMFELVNSIEEYPRFLPWCSKSHIDHQEGNVIDATLEISWSGIHKSFTTKNTSHPFQKIEIQLVSGPFKHLQGVWEFIPLGEHGCKIKMELEFEFAGHFVDRIFQPIFNHIANSLVEAFCKRAVEIYGEV